MLYADDTTVERYGNTIDEDEITVPTVKYGGGLVFLWGYLAPCGGCGVHINELSIIKAMHLSVVSYICVLLHYCEPFITLFPFVQ